MVIYVDVLLIVNFLISYFLMLASALLAGYTYERKRIVAGALVSAVFCLYIFVQGKNIIFDILFKLFSLFVSSSISFGFSNRRKFLIQTSCYLFLNMLLTGTTALISIESKAVYYSNMFFYFKINPVVLVLASGVIYISIMMFEMIKDRITPQKTYTMDVVFDEFSLCGLTAFYDSGCNIKDIVSNKEVILISIHRHIHQMPHNVAQSILRFVSEDYEHTQVHFVPVFFKTISGEGMLPGIKTKYIMVENKRIENVVAAFTDKSLGENVSVLFGTDIKRQV